MLNKRKKIKNLLKNKVFKQRTYHFGVHHIYKSELFSRTVENWAVFHSTVGKIVICAFISGFLLDLIGHKILKTTIDTKNKAVFITGCDSGIGYSLAKRLDLRGYDVFAGCLSPSKGGGLDLTETCSNRLRTIQLDVTKNQSILDAKDFIRNNLGESELWAVVNNAGIYRAFTVELCTLEHFKDAFDVNVMGTVRVTKAFLPLLRQSKGRLVNINSLAGRFYPQYKTAYTMTKHATVALTECLRQEMSKAGVKVISVDPEYFQTSIATEDLIDKLMKESVDNLDDDLNGIYNEKRVKQLKHITKLIFDYASPNINIPIDEIERAISAVHPDSVYTPCRNWIIKLLLYTGRFLPTSVSTSVQKLQWKLLDKYVGST